MYSRLGRLLFVVGHRKFSQKLCENAKFVGLGAFTAHSSSGRFLRRNYCDKSAEETERDVPKLLPIQEEASMKLKNYLENPDNAKMLKIIELEVEMARQNNERVPDDMKASHWYELLQLDSRAKRKRYMSYVWAVERKKENHKASQEVKRKVREERGPCESPYRLGNNTMFLRIYETTMNRLWNSHVINASLYGQPVVLDCSYESYMTRKEIKYCARQLKLSFAINRVHDEPFDMHLCNADKTGDLMKALNRFIPPLYDTDFPINVESRSYLDVFDRDRLVYLTPHCQEEMKEFDHNAVYIIGAFIDKATNEPVSLAKAKKEGLKMLRLPLDRYLQWGCSSGKNLTLNAVLSILLDIRRTGSWPKALENVPRRKLWATRMAAQERRNAKIFNVISNRDESESESDLGDSRDDDDEVTPLREIRPKAQTRFNEAPRSSMKSRTDFRSGYGAIPRTPRRTDSEAVSDFSMEARAKLKKNWKN